MIMALCWLLYYMPSDYCKSWLCKSQKYKQILHSSNFTILLVAILKFPRYFFFFARLQCHDVPVFSVLYQQKILADYCVEKSTHILLFFRRCFILFRQIYDFKNIFFYYRTMILLKLKATRYKKKMCNGCIYWIAFAPHPHVYLNLSLIFMELLCLFILKRE